MSNFNCEQCGRAQVDKDRVGYVAGCCHYPPESRFHETLMTVWFSDDEKPSRAFYSGGAWYKSQKAKARRESVHPVAWDYVHCHHGNIEATCEECSFNFQCRYGG